MTIYRTAVLTTFVFAFLTSTSAIAQNSRQIVDDHRFGCTNKEYLSKLIRYSVDKDLEAFKKGLVAGIVSKICTLFEKGESVLVVDTAIFSGLVKLRRKGEIKEYWTVLEAIERR